MAEQQPQEFLQKTFMNPAEFFELSKKYLPDVMQALVKEGRHFDAHVPAVVDLGTDAVVSLHTNIAAMKDLAAGKLLFTPSASTTPVGSPACNIALAAADDKATAKELLAKFGLSAVGQKRIVELVPIADISSVIHTLASPGSTYVKVTDGAMSGGSKDSVLLEVSCPADMVIEFKVLRKAA